MRKRKIPIELNETTIETLDEIAKLVGLKRSHIIRFALTSYIAHNDIHVLTKEAQIHKGVYLFSNAQINKLSTAKNLRKGSWQNLTRKQLLRRLQEEVEELLSAKGISNTKDEAVDVGNFAMMLFDNAGRRG